MNAFINTSISKATLVLLELARMVDCQEINDEISEHKNDSVEELKKFLDHCWHEGMPGGYMQGPEFRTDGYLDGAPLNVIRWCGTFTEGRYVEVTFNSGDAVIEYKTGTNKPSTYLNKIFRKAKLEGFTDVQ